MSTSERDSENLTQNKQCKFC